MSVMWTELKSIFFKMLIDCQDSKLKLTVLCIQYHKTHLSFMKPFCKWYIIINLDQKFSLILQLNVKSIAI